MSEIEDIKKEINLIKERKKKVEEVLRRVGLWDFRNHYPHQLSGGMKQRTSLAYSQLTQNFCLWMNLFLLWIFKQGISCKNFYLRYGKNSTKPLFM